MNIKQSTLSLAVLSACGLGFSGGVLAETYAYSYSEISNLTTTFTCTVTGTGCYSLNGTPGDLTDDIDSFKFVSYSSTSTSNANLDPNNVTGTSSTRTHSAKGDPLSDWTPSIASPDALVSFQANGDLTAPANNSFTQIGSTPIPGSTTTDYAKADAQIVQEQVTGLSSTSASKADAEALINTKDSSVAFGTNSSSTGFDIAFAVDEDWSFSVQFVTDLYLEAWTTTTGGSATANLAISFSITDQDTQQIVFSWSPDGTINTSGTGVASESADDYDLTLDAVDNLADGNETIIDPVCSGGVCNFGVTSIVFGGGNYNLSYRQYQAVDVSQTRQVPEPASLALLGLGLLGLGFARRGNRKV